LGLLLHKARCGGGQFGCHIFRQFWARSPKEVVSYLVRGGVTEIKTQTFQLQGADDVVCGHLCLHVLRELAKSKKFEDIILDLV